MLNTPSNPTAHADQLFQRGDFAGAVKAYRKLLKALPRNADILHRLALAEAQQGSTETAIKHLEQASRLRPTSAAILTDLGQALMGARRYEDAERAYDKALEVNPSLAFALANKVELFQLLGDYDKAATVLEEGLARFPDDIRLAQALGRLAPRIGKIEEAADTLERLLQRGITQRDRRMTTLYLLGDLHDKLGNYDRAFERFTQANALIPARFSEDMHRRAVDLLVANWTPQRVRDLPRTNSASEVPLFIVGMPRSGTSLVEQILASHARVHGAGELPTIPRICFEIAGRPIAQEPMLSDPSKLSAQVLERQALAYLRTISVLDTRASRITDKLPSNYLHLGLISRMFPRARVIHCTRDPLDTCLSCFFQHFRGAFPWSYRLDWCGAYYRQYERVMECWGACLEGLQMLEVPYEKLVDNQEEWSRRLIDFAGLEWDDACLKFYESKRVVDTLSNEQVRRPMYRGSINRHLNYTEHLAPLRQALGME